MPGIIGALGLLMLLLSGWLWLRDPPRQLCPGPRLRGFVRLMPLTLIYRPRCGYDLRGHRLDSRDVIVCPECGREIRRRREMVRTPRAWRPVRLACMFIVCGVMIYRHPPLSALTIVQHTPTDMLLRGEGMLGVGTPLEVRDEIRRRAMEHELDDQQISQLVRLLVNDLKNDALLGNARDALERLAIFGVFDPAPLLEALNSPDKQQRGLTREVLRSMPNAGPAPHALLQASIDDLRSDDVWSNRRSAREYLQQHLEQAKPLLIDVMFSQDAQQRGDAMNLLRQSNIDGPALQSLLQESVGDLRSDDPDWNRNRSFDYLLHHAEAAEPLLRDGMASDDRQQRLLCAVVAGCAARIDLLDRAAPILISHLADNNIEGDAIVAARALCGFGHPVLHVLERYRHSADEQQRQAVEYLTRRMTTDDSLMKLQRELPKARLTLAADDALALQPEYLDLPRIPRE